ncbi:phosphatase PAP2 family protein [Cryobacterium sp. BB307]|uniref:phosphatase PAP2 family protein n=1 Tax=Cryobacterium sp. BB307 TaxID=2716317 RepID=UPI0014478BAD|nr:phosphatase PAP2 family protein [Cryobacterium sp. BB307]
MQGRESTRKASWITRHWPLVSGLVAVVLAVLLGVLVFVRHNQPLLLDTEWMKEILEDRVPYLEVPALFLNFIGGGWVAHTLVPLGMVAVLLALRMPRAALYFAIALLTSVAVVQGLKAVFGRPRPEEMLVPSDFGSFPSGHVANAATLAVALAIIFARTWVWVLGAAYVAAMAWSRTYLGVHWLSDTIGGALIGAGIAVIVWAPFAIRLNHEREARFATDSVSTPG